jgi:hypothetical protein
MRKFLGLLHLAARHFSSPLLSLRSRPWPLLQRLRGPEMTRATQESQVLRAAVTEMVAGAPWGLSKLWCHHGFNLTYVWLPIEPRWTPTWPTRLTH